MLVSANKYLTVIVKQSKNTQKLPTQTNSAMSKISAKKEELGSVSPQDAHEHSSWTVLIGQSQYSNSSLEVNVNTAVVPSV